MEREEILEKEARESLANYIRWPRFDFDEASCLTSCLLPICMRNSSLHVGSETEYLDLNLNKDVKKCYNKCVYVSWSRLINRYDYVKGLESEVKLCGNMVTEIANSTGSNRPYSGPEHVNF